MSDIETHYKSKKQNDGMELYFIDKGISFNKLSINSEIDNLDTHLTLVKNYNEYLKNISKITNHFHKRSK